MPLKTYEIWAEGYQTNGEHGTASLLNRVVAANFLDACRKKYHWDSYYSERDGIPYYWGCRLFDNEADARKAFG